MKSTRWLYAAGALMLAVAVRAGIIVYNATLVNTTGLTANATYTLDLQNNGINSLSAQAIYSSATIANVTFQDGAQSTGSFTVTSYTALSSATAVNHITIASNSGLAGVNIALPGYVLINGLDWATGNTSSNTATSLAAALNAVPYLKASATGSIVYTTAAASGSLYNSYSLVSSSPSFVTVATSKFTGGQDNATISINGVSLIQGSGKDWSNITSAHATAVSLAAAINANSSLNTLVKAAASGTVVTATSTLTGAAYNFLLQVSTPAITLSGAHMINGTTSAVTKGSSVITAPNGSTLTTALPVLYSGTPAIGGLLAQATYYVVPVTGNSFMLSNCSTCAVAGTAKDLVVVTSTSTQILDSIHTYTLAPLPITGTPGLSWDVSNDGTNYFPLAVSSVTINSYQAGGTSMFWSFGFIGTRYLRLDATAPTTGALNLKVTVIGTN